MTKELSYLRPEYRRTGRPPQAIDGVMFHSYRTGIGRFAQISEDGQIMVRRNYEKSTYGAAVIGAGGSLMSPSGKHKVFRSDDAAARAAIQVWRKLQANP